VSSTETQVNVGTLANDNLERVGNIKNGETRKNEDAAVVDLMRALCHGCVRVTCVGRRDKSRGWQLLGLDVDMEYNGKM
jgi:hypothetical protein